MKKIVFIVMIIMLVIIGCDQDDNKKNSQSPEPTLDDKTPEEGVLYDVEGYNRSSDMFINDGSHDDENVYVKATTAEQDYYYIRNIYEYPDGYSLVSGEKNWASFVNKTVNKLRINYLVDEKIAFWVELERDADSNIKVNSSMIEARSEQEQAASVIPKVDRISYVYKAGKYIYYLTNEKCNFNYIEKDEKIFSHTLPYITLFSIS